MADVVSCPKREDLHRFLVGRLAEADTERMQQHLAGCSRCLDTLQGLEAEDPLLEALRAQGDAADRSEDAVVAGLIAHLSGLRVSMPHAEATSETQAYLPTSDASPTDDAMGREAAAPPAVPGYEILGELGRGGMGVVYRAHHTVLKRVVALKMITAGSHAGPEHRARFKIEAESVARLQHPHVVQIYEVGEADGQPYCALEYVGGGSLAQKLGGALLPAHQAAAIVETLARAMHVAHQMGVIHRDLKPANVLLSADGTPKITDFGLARNLDEAGQTQSGAILGTPSYMAPEQAAGRVDAIGPAADTYALGAILYECLTGRPPFRAAAALDTIHQVMRDEPVSPRQLQPRTPRDLETICLKCLQKEPSRRYASALALADDLGRFRRGEPIQARPVGPIEKTWRWCRRNQRVAVLTAAVAVSLMLGSAAATVFGLLATDRAREALEARHLADRDRYVSTVRLAHRTWQDGTRDQVLELLESVRPEYTDNIDLRDWEWYYLHRLCRRPEFSVTHGPGIELNAIAYSPDGQHLATAGHDHTVRIWDVQTARELHVLKGHSRAVHGVAFRRDGTLASASRDGMVRLWDLRTGQGLRVLRGVADQLYCVAFSPDGKRVAAGGTKGRFQVWDVESGTVVLSNNADGTRLASCGDDANIKVWDPTTGQLLRTLQGRWKASCVTFHPDGRRLASSGMDARVRIWDTVTGQQQFNLMIPDSLNVSVVRFSPDGQRLASSSQDLVIRIWDLANLYGLISLRGHTQVCRGIAFSPDGKRLASASVDGTARLWDAYQDRDALRIREPSQTNTAVFSPDGQHVAAGCLDCTVRIRDASTGQEVLVFKAHPSRVNCVAYSPDGKLLATSSAHPALRLWDPRDGKLLGTLAGHQAYVGYVVFSPDGKRLASASVDKTVRLWDVASQRELAVLQGHTKTVFAVAFSPDGRRVVSASDDATARVWDVETGQELLTFKEHQVMVGSVAFRADGREVATGSGDLTIKIWDPSTGQVRLTLKGHRERMYGLKWHPSGSRLASASNDHTVRLWDTTSGQEVLALKAHNLQARGLAFSPDGRRLLSCSDDSTIKIWDATPTLDLEAVASVGVPPVDNTAARPRAAATPLPTPFVILAQGQERQIRFATLTEAVQATRPGDVIEIRGHGPFVTPAIDLGKRALVLRAGAGFEPVLQLDPQSLKANLPLLRTSAPLVLEGLHFRHVEEVAGKERPYLLIRCLGAPLSVSHCRFYLQGNRLLTALSTWRAPQVDVRHCEFGGAFHNAIGCDGLASFYQMEVADNLSWGATFFVYYNHYPPEVARDVVLRMSRNTFVGHMAILQYYRQLPEPPANPDLRPFQIDARENVFDGNVVFGLVVTPEGKFQPDVDRPLLPRCLAWHESKNLYAGGLLFLGQHAGKFVDVFKTLASWQAYWGVGETGTLHVRPRFQGGAVKATKTKSPEKVTAADFRLDPKRDGKDLGADVAKVGPGKAYEAWKRTPAYAQWLAATGQVRDADPFVVLVAGVPREFPFASLAKAVQAAQSGDVIEVRGDGPFITEPVKLGDKALTLRAGKGFTPVIQLSTTAIKAGAALLETNAPLTLEGLEFQRVGTEEPPVGPPRKLLVSHQAPLHVAQCRFLVKGGGPAVAAHAVTSGNWEVRNCFFAGAPGGATGLYWLRPPGGQSPPARDVGRPEALRPEEFRLPPGDPSQGADAALDLVGPGAAYDYWKKTPAYEDWLTATGQAP